MIRFTLKSLMYVTAVVATYGLLLRSAVGDSTWRYVTGMVVLAILVIGKIAYDERNAMINERIESAKPPV